MTEGTAPAQRGPGFRAFLFSDLRGYTAFIEASGDEAGARLLDRYRGLVRRVIAEHDGAEIRTEGDSFYVIFPSASAAVAAGVSIVDGARALSTEDPKEPVNVGVGIHAGETAETAEGPVGSAINVAARICAAARPGEVLVSETVRGLVRTSSTIAFTSRGRPPLKGVSEPIELYAAVERSGAATGAARPRRPRPNATTARFGIVLVILAILGFGAGIAVSGNLLGRTALASPSGELPGGLGSVGPSGPGAVAASSAPEVSGGAATSTEDDLLALLPPAIAKTCLRATRAEGSLGGTASLRCELSSQDADTVWYDVFQTRGLATEQFDRIAATTGVPAGTCSDTVTLAVGEWRYGSSFGGRMICYAQGGASWLVWTYENDHIVAQAVRGDADGAALYRWWKDVGPYLR